MVEAVVNDPGLADTFDWSKLDAEDWRFFFREAPKLAEKYEDDWRDWSKMNGRQWVRYLKRPDGVYECDWFLIDWYKIGGTDLAGLLIDSPDFIEDCDLSLMNGEGWVKLLSTSPELKDQCKDWWKLDGNDWATLLSKCPYDGFDEYCDWFKLDEENWNVLLMECPEFSEKCLEMGFNVPKDLPEVKDPFEAIAEAAWDEHEREAKTLHASDIFSSEGGDEHEGCDGETDDGSGETYISI